MKLLKQHSKIIKRKCNTVRNCIRGGNINYLIDQIDNNPTSNLIELKKELSKLSIKPKKITRVNF